MNRESDTELERESDVYFGLGAGTEVYITNNIALRFEGYMHDLDAISGSANLVFRFGGSTPRAARPASTTSESLPPADESQDSALSSAPEPEPTASPSDGVQEADLEAAASGAAGGAPSADDRDGDGIMNAGDQCADSNAGYPVRADGCPLFDGVLSGIRFVAGTAELEPSSFGQLDFLGLMLVNKYPNARIELHAHTDDEGDARSQSILTRARLRTVGTYLVGKGLRSNRMVLRSFGGSRPLYDNSTLEGRAANNRMEIFERPR